MKYWDGHGELVDHLVENGLDINRVDYRRTTLLLDACLRQSRASESLCSLYLDNDADPYIANTEGQSPASLDDRYSYGEAIDPLDFHQQFKKPSLFTALEIAGRMNNRPLCRAFIEAGAETNSLARHLTVLLESTTNEGAHAFLQELRSR